jgi:hypothetical protein
MPHIIITEEELKGMVGLFQWLTALELIFLMSFFSASCLVTGWLRRKRAVCYDPADLLESCPISGGSRPSSTSS